jgi:dTDP-4-dehydrorhamnose reductase
MIKICILGAGGQLGQEFQYQANKYGWAEITFYDRNAIDITNRNDINQMIQRIDPEFIINCAAYTAVDKAERDVDKCMAINTDACRVLATAIQDTNIKLLHFSTDYVYNQFEGFPLLESDQNNPPNVYGKSKLAGELVLRNADANAMIIRTSWVVSPFGHNFVKTMIKLGKEKSEISVVNDQYGAPTYTLDLVDATMKIISSCVNDPEKALLWKDTYNFANEGVITWFDMATYIMFATNSSCLVNPIETHNYPTPATRPLWSVMSKHKLKKCYGIQIPHWRTALHDCIERCKLELTD